MADQDGNDPSQASETWPDPPPFWRDFTAEKLQQMESLKTRYADQNGIQASSVVRVPDVPDSLINLQPPPEPTEGKWRLYATPATLANELQSLEEAGVDDLVPNAHGDIDGKHIDRAFELKKLAKSLLLNFLECMGVMGIAPQQGSEKAKDLRTLLLNMHHILNEYRPHQAREQLIALMQDQLDAKRAETAAISAVTDKARRVLEGLGSIDMPPDTSAAQTVVGKDPVNSVQLREQTQMREDLQRERQKDTWLAIESGLY